MDAVLHKAMGLLEEKMKANVETMLEKVWIDLGLVPAQEEEEEVDVEKPHDGQESSKVKNTWNLIFNTQKLMFVSCLT